MLDFLKRNESERLYLVGDIIDCWRLTRSWYWHSRFDQLIACIQSKIAAGTRVIYVPGNHDEAFRVHAGKKFAGVKVLREVIHQTADGRRLLVFHGDELDDEIRMSSWIVQLGDWSYDMLVWANLHLNRLRQRFGKDYWSLTSFIKSQVENARAFTEHFEQAAAARGRERGFDGVICGHIHQARVRDIDGVGYYNCGDWVESCTAIVESWVGELSLVRHASIGAEHLPIAPRPLAAMGVEA